MMRTERARGEPGDEAPRHSFSVVYNRAWVMKGPFSGWVGPN